MELDHIHDSVLVAGEPGKFRSTDWSMVLSAAGGNSAAASEALERLCQTYWYPLYAFVRRRGYDCADAKDLTQDFFAHLLEKQILQFANQGKGRFRTFLLASLKNLLANDWDRKHAVKRGGRQTIISLDDDFGEQRYLREPSHEATPEKIFEQTWALTLLQTVVERLKKQYADAGKAPLFETIQDYLSGDGSATYGAIAAKLNMTEGAVKMSVLRMRRHFGYLLREEISRTVSEPTEVEDELRYLFASLGG